MSKITVQDIVARKHRDKRKITALTAYDFPFAKLVDDAGMDIVLVGDSLGMVCLGYESTVSVVMDEMLHHAKAASRATKRALVVVDMPFGSYEDAESAVLNGQRLVNVGGAEAVKLEGGAVILKQVAALIKNRIPVMGHLGMTPQSVQELGGYKVQGRTKRDAERIFEDAKMLERLGVFSIVLECVPYALGRRISESLKIPTIGIGAGPYTDGQILVLHDLLGFESSVRPRFVRRYAELDRTIREALARFRNDVLKGTFPTLGESFKG